MLQLPLNYFAIGTILLVFIFINLALFFRLKQNWIVTNKEFFAHLLLDVAGLSLLLYLTGGANNPFVSYLLVPVTISAAILPWFYTWIVAGIALLSYSVLLFFYQALPELMPMDMAMTDDRNFPGLHIVGMWFNFLVSAALITYFVVKMAQEIRTQEEKLVRYREENLRDEQILAVATQAAGTAHEIGTPLSTAAILLNDIEKDYADNASLQKDISLIRQQITNCKNILQDLVKHTDLKSATTFRKVVLVEFVNQILDQWQLLKPEVKLSLSIKEDDNCPSIQFESTLQQAIVNILNNAAEASPVGIDINVTWSKAEWLMSIRDYGEGISTEIAEQLGTNVVTTKESGLGMGLILSQASINRLGGSVGIFQHEEKGSVIEIKLPLVE
ncbi:ATP-binding protein [Gammaproteobacteria bacterium]|nr:ATP-binding protein [Gammaproteobacteria bacterium]